MRGIVFMAVLTGTVMLTPLRRSRFAWFLLVMIGLLVASVYLLN
jgi:hypothetical protein